MKARHLCLALIAALSLMGVAEPASALRCSGKIIGNGKTKAEVREFCGEPACTRKPGTVFVKKSGIYWPMAADEEWVYNFGPGQFIQLIRFYYGKVVFIQSAGYGWTGERDCADVPAE
jgi:hypothetical protein